MTLFNTNETVSESLDRLFARETGIYGRLEDLPLAWQLGHHRRTTLLDRLDIGDVTHMVCVDFGCGNWGFAGVYPKLHNCAFAYGLDISATAIEQSLRATLEGGMPYKDRCKFLKSDGMDIPLPDGAVDLLFAGEAIEHMRFPKRFLAECYRVLKPHGQIVITTPNRDALLYRIQDDIYGNWTEHFWVSTWPELQEMIGEFFEIEEYYGFNGSIYRDLDKTAADRQAAEIWSRMFEDRPDLATGIIVRGRKGHSDIRYRYELTPVPPDSIHVSGESLRLETAFGLYGTMIDNSSSVISFPCARDADGLVVVMWSHAWSGFGTIQVGQEVHRVNLWAQDPGWRPFEFALPAAQSVTVTIKAEGSGERRALAPQVIFCDAFTYKR